MPNSPKRTEQIRPTDAPVDSGGEPPDDGSMDARLNKVESDIAAIKIDLAVLKATCATKTDIAELRAKFSEFKTEIKGEIADAKVATIIWITTAIFLGQLLPSILKLFI